MTPFSRSHLSAYGRYSRAPIVRRLTALALDVQCLSADGARMFVQFPSGAGLLDRREVVDAVGGYGSTLFGHHHPRLVSALTRALTARAPFAAQGTVRGPAGQLAETLSSMVEAETGRRSVVTLASTGAEVVDASLLHSAAERDLRLARLEETLTRSLRRLRRDGLHLAVLEAGTAGGDTVGGCTVGGCTAEEVLQRSLDILSVARATDALSLVLGGAFHGRTVAAGTLTDHPRSLAAPRGPRHRRVSDPTGSGAGIESSGDDVLVTIHDVVVGPDGVPTAVPYTVSQVACVIVEPIRGEGGVHPVPLSTLLALRALADRHHAALVADEIQSGMGRTGDLFALTSSAVVADHYLLSKSLGGGLTKISALVVDARRAVESFSADHTSTFGEDDLSAIVATEALALLVESRPRIIELGARLLSGLEAVRSEYPDVIADVRGRGLLLGVEFAVPSPAPSPALRAVLAEESIGYSVAGHLLHAHDVRVLPTLSAPTTIRIQPAAVLSDADADRIVESVRQAARLLAERRFAELLAPLGTPTTTCFTPPAVVPRARPEATVRPGRVAFLATMSSPRDLRALAPELGSWSDDRLAALLDRTRGESTPFEVSRGTVTDPSGATVEVCAIAVPVTAAQIVDGLREGHGAWLRDLVLQGVDLAAGLGAEVVGLGGYTSVVTAAARDVVEDRIRVTSGNSLTAASVLDQLHAHLAAREPGARRIAVVGAAGNIGAVLAAELASVADELVLVGTRAGRRRVEAVAGDLRARGHRVSVADSLRDAGPTCDVVVTATNSASPLVTPADLPTDRRSVVVDLAVPGDVHPSVLAMPLVTVITGGRMALPRGQRLEIPASGLAPGTVFSCLAETLLLGLEPGTPSPSYGALHPEGIAAARDLAARHGMTPVLPRIPEMSS